MRKQIIQVQYPSRSTDVTVPLVSLENRAQCQMANQWNYLPFIDLLNKLTHSNQLQSHNFVLLYHVGVGKSVLLVQAVSFASLKHGELAQLQTPAHHNCCWDGGAELL